MSEIINKAPNYTIFAYHSNLVQSNVISLSFDTEYWINRRMIVNESMTDRLHRFLADFNQIEDFPQSLKVKMTKHTGILETSSRNVLSQNIKFLYFEFNHMGFCVLQKMQDFTYYSAPIVYKHRNMTNMQNTIFGYQKASLSSEGGFTWDTDDGGQTWVSRNGLSNLELYELSNQRVNEGKRLVFNKNLYCPETGYQMYPVEV